MKKIMFLKILHEITAKYLFWFLDVTTENPKHRGKHNYAFSGKHIEEKLIAMIVTIVLEML